jgi:GNAT superfamily N-acetyltransferase
LDQVDRLLITAYDSPSRRAEVALYLEVQPDGWFVIESGDAIIAMAGALAYGPFCWLGLVATHPAWRGQGLATRLSSHLIEWASRHGCKTVALDASAAGQPIYERRGFRAVGFTVELSVPTAIPGIPRSKRARQGADELDELVRLDLHGFGGNRARLLHAIPNNDRCRCYRLPDLDNELAGYLIARDGVLGPGWAHDSDTACELVRAASSRMASVNGHELLLRVPMESSHLGALLDLGLHERRRLVHMRLGETVLPGHRDRLIAQTNFAAG